MESEDVKPELCESVNPEEIASVVAEDNEFGVEEQVIFVTDDASIVIDEDTTFVDEDGNPVIVNKSFFSNSNEPLVIINEGDNIEDALRKYSTNESDDKTSKPPNDLEKDVKVADDNPLQESKDLDLINYPSTGKPVLFLQRKAGTSTDEANEACNSITIIEKEGEEIKQEAENVLANVPEDAVLDPLTCRFCLKVFSKNSNKLRHLRSVHKVRQHSRNFIRCVECNTLYAHVKALRDHLRTKHNMNMETHKKSFPNMSAFLKWKHEIQRRELTRFTLRQGRRQTQRGLKFTYVCHRAGKYEDRSKGPRKRMLRTSGTCKLGMMCTATITVEERPDEVVAEYCLHHYGHGKETTFVRLTQVEQSAIQENISHGIPYENLLDDLCEDVTNELFQGSLIKGKDIKVIKNAFQCEDYNSGLSDADSVDRWVRMCCQMDDSPILFYQHEVGVNEEFLLIIMTEFQRNILMSSDKKILCVDSLFRRKGLRFYLTCLVAMDESEMAFPVAFCISNKVDKIVIKQFYMSIKESTGELSCSYFMSDSEKFFHEAWLDVMGDDSKWIWSIWYVDQRIKVQLRPFKGDLDKRGECYRTMRKLLECQSPKIFETMYKIYIEELNKDPQTRPLAHFITQKYGHDKELWAYCFHRDIKLSSIIQLEVLHNTLHFCGKEARKKRLDKFIFVILKLVRFKMLDRLARILDDEKIAMVLEAINKYHSMGLEIPTDRVSSLADKVWLIRSDDEEENVYIVREFETCPDHCAIKCNDCDICVHMFSCSCAQSMINANLCQHIHAVVWKFLTPHFSSLPSPEHDDTDNDEQMDVSAPLDQPSPVCQLVMKKTHELFKTIRGKKFSLTEECLGAVMSRLNECFDICSGKGIPVKLPPLPATQTVLVPSNMTNMFTPIAPMPQLVMLVPSTVKR